MPASIFADAPRLHSGLGANEFPAILQGGEEVIPRNETGVTQIDAGGQQGGDNYTINIQALDSESFEEYLRRNPGALASALQNMANKGNAGFRFAVNKVAQ